MTDTFKKEHIPGMAHFALGRFIEYRLKDGMGEKDLEPWMQAYINMGDDFEGRPHRSLEHIQSQKVTVSPSLQQEIDQVSPSWLPDCEKLAILDHLKNSHLDNSFPDE